MGTMNVDQTYRSPSPKKANNESDAEPRCGHDKQANVLSRHDRIVGRLSGLRFRVSIQRMVRRLLHAWVHMYFISVWTSVVMYSNRRHGVRTCMCDMA